MSDRFDVVPIWRGHWRGLSMRQGRTTRSDDLARAVTIAVPGGVFLLVGALNWELPDATAAAIIAAGGLITAGSVTAFAQLAAWRSRLTERQSDYDEADRPLRQMIDESVSHILLVVIESVAVVLVAALSTAGMPKSLTVIASAVTMALLAHIALLFVVLASQLYSAYTQINRVDDSVNGFYRIRH